jgi:hypothetical protein
MGQPGYLFIVYVQLGVCKGCEIENATWSAGMLNSVWKAEFFVTAKQEVRVCHGIVKTNKREFTNLLISETLL